MPSKDWRAFLEKHRDEVTNIARRVNEDGTGTLYVNLNDEVRENKATGKIERYYYSFPITGKGKRGGVR